ncbi:polyphosphate polymerase domain-containing protein [Nocardioides ferulae]|uniref:polyphosphate polymerase domain-containing protein n=1 Tax=Nocardioides ferulae TaxID=2340821 RepID=UPI00197EF48D|nr:polyphosphate polymerase domain-containing protein [Nocardioides ferulae]
MSGAAEMEALAGLPGVDLQALNDAAALLTRTDRKYVVPVETLAPLVADIPGLRVLEIAGRRGSHYESTYFDTTDLDSWAATAHPRRRRWKVRTRLYADSGECWLEVKTRGARAVTVKERALYDASHRDEVTPGSACAWVGDRLAAAGVSGVDPGGLVATLRTGYLRTTLLLPGGTGRATIDTGLTWTSASGRARAGDVLVVETKSPPGSAGPLDRRLWQLGHRPVRISKYGTGLAVLTPGLPANRWHRVTSRHLAATLRIHEGAAA